MVLLSVADEVLGAIFRVAPSSTCVLLVEEFELREERTRRAEVAGVGFTIGESLDLSVLSEYGSSAPVWHDEPSVDQGTRREQLFADTAWTNNVAVFVKDESLIEFHTDIILWKDVGFQGRRSGEGGLVGPEKTSERTSDLRKLFAFNEIR